MAVYKTDLGFEGHFVYQDTEDFAFSQDSVFLANTANISNGDAVVDLGSGSGIISVLIALKRNVGKVVGVEIKESACELAKRTVFENNLSEKIEIVCADVKNAAKILGYGKFDKVLCNPPYFETFKIDKNKETRMQSDELSRVTSEQLSPREIGRTESSASLADFIASAKNLLKFGGELTIIQKHNRLCDLMFLLRGSGLEPKHIIYIVPKHDADVDTVIVRARLGGKSGLTSEIFTVLNADGAYSEKYCEIYSGGKRVHNG